jgi:hypothetical protein
MLLVTTKCLECSCKYFTFTWVKSNLAYIHVVITFLDFCPWSLGVVYACANTVFVPQQSVATCTELVNCNRYVHSFIIYVLTTTVQLSSLIVQLQVVHKKQMEVKANDVCIIVDHICEICIAQFGGHPSTFLCDVQFIILECCFIGMFQNFQGLLYLAVRSIWKALF